MSNPDHPPATGADGHGFGTMPVFLAGISTILGAVMFLRFGYAVGHTGLLGALAIVGLGHLVTIPTALALSEIATNRKVEGGGEYFIISRSFGIRIGSAIGMSLYLSQAISIAFYVIAFAEAFSGASGLIERTLNMPYDPRMISIPAALLLGILMLTRGADLGVKALYVVVGVLALSLLLFFVGSPVAPEDGTLSWSSRVDGADPFFVVFAVVFPSFTGMTAGVGLSGDLAEPRRSIPRGTIAATLAGMAIYVAIAFKLEASASASLLANDQLVMAEIALWSPIIPIGLACATLSSALGSFLVAPRTLQALAKDGCFVPEAANRALSHGVGEANEPRSATFLTLVLVVIVIALGDIDLVARLISMFFMVTYGALCAISFLEHLAGNPGYRPTFRTRWYLSLLGALMCGLMMFLMDPLFAALAIAAMVGLYGLTRFTRAGADDQSIVAVFLGVMSQTTRWLQLVLQRGTWAARGRGWRPSIVALNPRSLTDGLGAVELLGWLSERHGIGTYIQLVRGKLESSTHAQAVNLRERLVEMTQSDMPGLYIATMVSPSLRSAAAQVLQMPGVSGLDNNTLLLDFRNGRDDDAAVDDIVSETALAADVGKNVLIYRDDGSRLERRQRIDVWLTWHDERNAKLMLMLAYIIAGHENWKRAEIRVFAALPGQEVAEERRAFAELCTRGRIPIPERNISFLAAGSPDAYAKLVTEHSGACDLLIVGMSKESLVEQRRQRLTVHEHAPHTLFVLARQDLEL